MSRSRSATLSKILPWAALAVMGALLLLQVYRYGSNLPFIDEWYDTVPALTGQHPVDVHWLWSPFNGHRIFLPRLALLGALRMGHGNFRAGCFLNAITLIVAVAILLRGLSQRVNSGTTAAGMATRGGLVWTDALLPILFLNWGTQGDVLWPFEIQFALTVLLVALTLATIYRSIPTLPRGGVVCLMIAFLLLPLCGLNGLLFVPLAALWTAATPLFAPTFSPTPAVAASDATVAAAPAVRPPISRVVLWLLLFLPAVLLLAYFAGLPHEKHPIPTPARFVRGALDFLQLGWGICRVDLAARPYSSVWISGVIPLLALIGFLASFALPLRAKRPLPMAAVLAAAAAATLTLVLVALPRVALRLSATTMLLFAPFLLAMAGVALWRIWRDTPPERCRTAGMTALYLSGVLLALGVAFGRGGGAEAVSSPHYTILSALAPCIAYFAIRLVDTPTNRRVCALLFFWVLLLLPINMNRSRQGQIVKKAEIAQFNADLAAGMSIPVLIGKYQEGALGRFVSPEQYELDLRAMKAAQVAHFENVNDTPSLYALFRGSGVPLTTEDDTPATFPAPLASKFDDWVTWKFAPIRAGAMVYVRFTEPAAPGLPAAASDTSPLAEYNVIWRLSASDHTDAQGTEGETLYAPNTHVVEQTHDSVFYMPAGVDGISIVCTRDGAPLTVTKLCVVPIPTGNGAAGAAAAGATP